MKVMQYRPAQKGKALGTSGFITDWSFAHSNPADSAALQLAQDGQQERGNLPTLLLAMGGSVAITRLLLLLPRSRSGRSGMAAQGLDDADVADARIVGDGWR